MELRYLGFAQQQKLRAYSFDCVAKGEPTRHFVITADLALFLAHRVGIQEGPGLCARKVATELVESSGGTHELTGADLRAHVAARTLAAAKKPGPPRFVRRKPAAEAAAQSASPWRGPRL
jgi:hypothetical protein